MQAESIRMSDEPLIRAVHRRFVEMALATYAAFLAYISFVPFDFIKPLPSSGRGLFLGIALVGGNVPDIFVNIGIYIPLGALAWIACRRFTLGRMSAVIGAVLFAGMLSFGIEYAQRWIGSRVSSWVDVVANLFGAGIGAVILNIGSETLRSLVEQIRTSARRNWWSAAAKVAVCLILVVHLRPYDMVVDVRHTAASLVRHAELSPFAAWNGLGEQVESEIKAGRRAGMHELQRVQWEYTLDRIVDVAVYAALTLTLWLGMVGRRSKRNSFRRWAWTGFVVLSLAMMVTLIRIFLISHGLDTAHVFCGVLGWLIGCNIALTVTLPEKRQSRIRLPRAVILSAMTGVLLVSVAYELVPFDFSKEAAQSLISEGVLSNVPFAMGFKSRANDAFYDITGEMLRYGAIGLCIAVWLPQWTRWRWRAQVASSVLLTAAICIIFEAAHQIMVSRTADGTTVVIAMAASFAGSVGARWVVDYRRYLSIVMADDLLTSQLIEGESYDKNRELKIAERKDEETTVS